jgi:hypothetical protein
MAIRIASTDRIKLSRRRPEMPLANIRMAYVVSRTISPIARNARNVPPQKTPGHYAATPRTRITRPALISSIRSHMRLFFSLVVEGGCRDDADSQANASLHFVQNEVLVGLAARQYLKYFCPFICVSKLIMRE